MKRHSSYSTPLLAAAIAALTLAACSKQDERTAGQQVDATIAKVERQASEMKADANRGVDAAKQSATEVGTKIGDGITDATIITSLNVELARDGKLDPAKIDVDASRGRVALRGTAPDAESVARARQIALSIKGVTGVDNYLTVNGGKS
jgi:hyperosmotically inducible periplasmic protein